MAAGRCKKTALGGSFLEAEGVRARLSVRSLCLGLFVWLQTGDGDGRGEKPSPVPHLDGSAPLRAWPSELLPPVRAFCRYRTCPPLATFPCRPHQEGTGASQDRSAPA